MIKVKDGYAKLIGTTYKGSADRVLLSNGGDIGKAVASTANTLVLRDSTGSILHTVGSNLWITAAKGQGVAINIPNTGYYALSRIKSKTGNFTLSCHSVENNKFVIGYMTDETVAAGTNALNKTWVFDGDTGIFSGGRIDATRFVSTVATGTQPYLCTSTTLNTNLNADLLDGLHGSYYAAANSLGNYLPLAGGTMTGKIYFKVDGSDSIYIGPTTDPNSSTTSYLDFHVRDDANDGFRWTTLLWKGGGNVEYVMMKLTGSNTGISTLTLTGNMNASGTITANNFYGYLNGDISGTAASARDMGLTTITKTLQPTTSWSDTGIISSDIGNGVFILYLDPSHSNGNDGLSPKYAGLFVNYTGTNGSLTEEIILQAASHASYKRLFLRFINTGNTMGYRKLLIKADSNYTTSYSMKFYFRRII